MTRKSHQAMSALAKKWYVSFVPEGRQVKQQLKPFRQKARRKLLL
jgi:Mg2+/Co2+ transporter CorB